MAKKQSGGASSNPAGMPVPMPMPEFPAVQTRNLPWKLEAGISNYCLVSPDGIADTGSVEYGTPVALLWRGDLYACCAVLTEVGEEELILDGLALSMGNTIPVQVYRIQQDGRAVDVQDVVFDDEEEQESEGAMGAITVMPEVEEEILDAVADEDENEDENEDAEDPDSDFEDEDEDGEDSEDGEDDSEDADSDAEDR